MDQEIKPNQVYSTKEVRDFLKVSESTLKRLLKNGIIEAYKVGGVHRIWGRDILKLLSPQMSNKVWKTYKGLRIQTKKVIDKW